MNEKFSITEVATLRRDLVCSGLDSFQIAEAIKMFVGCHGYSISREFALDTAAWIERPDCSIERLRNELEISAWAM